MLRRLSPSLSRAISAFSEVVPALSARGSSTYSSSYDVNYKSVVHYTTHRPATPPPPPPPPSPGIRSTRPVAGRHLSHRNVCQSMLTNLPRVCRSPTEQVWPASKQQKKCEAFTPVCQSRVGQSHAAAMTLTSHMRQSCVRMAVAARVHGALTSVILQHAAYRETLLQQHGFTILEVPLIKHGWLLSLE